MYKAVFNEPEIFPLLLTKTLKICSSSSSTKAQASLPCYTKASDLAVHSVSNVCDITTIGILSIESVCSKIGAYHLT